MVSFDLPETPQPRVSPALLMGVASPLWSYFGAAAAGGVAYWWMTRWTRPMNLEALFGGIQALPAPEAVIAPVVAAIEAATPTVEDVLDNVAVSPLAEAVAPDVIEAAPEPALDTILDAAPEPVIEEPAPFAAEPALKPRTKKAPASEPEA